MNFPIIPAFLLHFKLISLTFADRQYNIEAFFAYFKPGLGFVFNGKKQVSGNYANMKPHIWTTFRTPEPFIDYIEFTEKVPWGKASNFAIDGRQMYGWGRNHLTEKNLAQLYLHYPKAGSPTRKTWLRGSYYLERYPRNWSYMRPSKK